MPIVKLTGYASPKKGEFAVICRHSFSDEAPDGFLGEFSEQTDPPLLLALDARQAIPELLKGVYHVMHNHPASPSVEIKRRIDLIAAQIASAHNCERFLLDYAAPLASVDVFRGSSRDLRRAVRKLCL